MRDDEPRPVWIPVPVCPAEVTVTLCDFVYIYVCVFKFIYMPRMCVCFITAGPITKLFAWGEEESGGHVL